MMDYYYGGMMSGVGFFRLITWVVVMVDLVLAGAWLWKKIRK